MSVLKGSMVVNSVAIIQKEITHVVVTMDTL